MQKNTATGLVGIAVLCAAMSSCQTYYDNSGYTSGSTNLPDAILMEGNYQEPTQAVVVEQAPVILAAQTYETAPVIKEETLQTEEIVLAPVAETIEIAPVAPITETIELVQEIETVQPEPTAVIPTVKPFQETKPVFVKVKPVSYTVKRGDSLSVIAQRYRVTVQDIAKANNLNPKKYLKIGQKLVIPGGKLRSKKELAALRAKRQKSYKARIQKTKKARTVQDLPSEGNYTVKSGDSLWIIARRYDLHVADIKAWNSLSSNSLRIGQKLKLNAATAPVVEANDLDIDLEVPKNTEVIEANVVEDPSLSEEAAKVEELVEAGVSALEEEVPAEVKMLEVDIFEGDTLESLSDSYGATVSLIKKYNPTIKSNEDLKEGIKIQIPLK